MKRQLKIWYMLDDGTNIDGVTIVEENEKVIDINMYAPCLKGKDKRAILEAINGVW